MARRWFPVLTSRYSGCSAVPARRRHWQRLLLESEGDHNVQVVRQHGGANDDKRLVALRTEASLAFRERQGYANYDEEVNDLLNGRHHHRARLFTPACCRSRGSFWVSMCRTPLHSLCAVVLTFCLRLNTSNSFGRGIRFDQQACQ